MPSNRPRGFTIVEVMIAVAIVSILAAIALPSYNAYIQRSRVPAGLDALSAYAARMEQAYQDSGSYGAGACTPTLPATVPNFAIACAVTGGGQGFTATATGSGPMSGYAFTIDNRGTRRTTSHPKGVPGTDCWSIRGGVCDDK